MESRLRALGASPLRTQINDEDGRSFLEHRGWERTNVMRLQAVDLTVVELPEPTVESVPLSAVDLHSVRPLYLAAHGDIPSRAPRAPFTEEDFRREVVKADWIDHEISSVILEDGEPVAFTIVIANHDDGRAGNQMTGVRRDRRGRGLAHAVKLAALRRARAAGLRTMLTSNDLENEPMLAVNRKLGFEPSVLIENYEKAL